MKRQRSAKASMGELWAAAMGAHRLRVVAALPLSDISEEASDDQT